jgi:hypothetical protein
VVANYDKQNLTRKVQLINRISIGSHQQQRRDIPIVAPYSTH